VGSVDELKLAVGEDVATEGKARQGATWMESRRHRVGSLEELKLAVGKTWRGLLGADIGNRRVASAAQDATRLTWPLRCSDLEEAGLHRSPGSMPAKLRYWDDPWETYWH